MKLYLPSELSPMQSVAKGPLYHLLLPDPLADVGRGRIFFIYQARHAIFASPPRQIPCPFLRGMGVILTDNCLSKTRERRRYLASALTAGRGASAVHYCDIVRRRQIVWQRVLSGWHVLPRGGSVDPRLCLPVCSAMPRTYGGMESPAVDREEDLMAGMPKVDNTHPPGYYQVPLVCIKTCTVIMACRPDGRYCGIHKIAQSAVSRIVTWRRLLPILPLLRVSFPLWRSRS